MAGLPRETLIALIEKGLESEGSKQDLIDSKNAAWAEIKESKGATLASMSGNGLAATFAPGSMTLMEWWTGLSTALRWVNAGRIPPSTTYARITR